MSQSLGALELPEIYRESRAHLFPSHQSLLWFIRCNREELVESGALLIIAGRKHINAARCDEIVMQLGQRAARKLAA